MVFENPECRAPAVALVAQPACFECLVAQLGMQLSRIHVDTGTLVQIHCAVQLYLLQCIVQPAEIAHMRSTRETWPGGLWKGG
eukprot:SAG11_NODE_6630_length_1276_cov_1.827528_2_plen_83_part_00